MLKGFRWLPRRDGWYTKIMQKAKVLWIELSIKCFFPLRVFSVNVTKSSKNCRWVTFTEEVPNRKFHFVCSDVYCSKRFDVVMSPLHIPSKVLTIYGYPTLGWLLLLKYSYCTKNEVFHLRISSVNVTKSAVSCVIGHICWGNP